LPDECRVAGRLQQVEAHAGEHGGLQDLDQPVDLHQGLDSHAHVPEHSYEVAGVIVCLQGSPPSGKGIGLSSRVERNPPPPP